jgi:putative endonuclease
MTPSAEAGKEMCYVYVLRSLKNNKRYVGYTTRDIWQRFDEHNQGYSKWSNQNKPFELKFAQECESSSDARKLEKFLKSGQGRQCLDELKI